MKDKLTRNDLKADLDKAEKELQELLTRAEFLREWITATKKLCGRPANESTQSQPLTFVLRRRTKTVELAAQVTDVLRSTGPMHVNGIASELAKRGHPVMAKNPAATLAVALSRRPDQFTKVAPNTFDLAKREAKAAG